MTAAHLALAQLVELAFAPTHQPDAWQAALARLRHAVEQDDTLPVHAENTHQAGSQAAQEATP